MKLRDNAAQYDSLYHLALNWARSDDSNFTFDEFVRSLNMAINRITAVIQRHDKTWKYKDTNSATGSLIDSTTDLLPNVNAYPISLPWLAISMVRIRDNEGRYHIIENVERMDVTSEAMLNPWLFGYYLLGGFLYLVGTPNYGYGDGIEIQYKTGPVHFTPSDSSKTVGYDPTFEELAALMPALDYLDINGPDDQATKVRTRIGIEPRAGAEGSGLLNALALSYQHRNEAPQSLSIRGNNRAIGGLEYGGGINPGYFPPPAP